MFLQATSATCISPFTLDSKLLPRLAWAGRQRRGRARSNCHWRSNPPPRSNCARHRLPGCASGPSLTFHFSPTESFTSNLGLCADLSSCYEFHRQLRFVAVACAQQQVLTANVTGILPEDGIPVGGGSFVLLVFVLGKNCGIDDRAAKRAKASRRRMKLRRALESYCKCATLL